MFGKTKKTAAQAPSLPKLPEGVQVHVMPEQFKGKALMMKKQPAPVAPKPAPKPQPKPVSKPVPKKPIPAKKKSGSGLLIVALLLVLVAIIGGIIAFILLTQEDPEPVIVEVPVEVPVEDVEPSEPVPALDTDSDGLTDVEEALYGTDHRNPDTDADTFLDGNEVFHRYDPLALSPSTLLDTGSVDIFLSPDTVFEVYYPASWEAASAFDMGTGVLSEVQFRTSNTATISIRAISDLPFATESAASIKAAGFEEGLTKEGYLSYEDQEELVFYVDAGESLYAFEYDLADESLIHFLQTFKMVVNSFKILE